MKTEKALNRICMHATVNCPLTQVSCCLA